MEKPCNTSATVALSYEVEATSLYISETVQASAKVTIECKYKVICDLANSHFQ